MLPKLWIFDTFSLMLIVGVFAGLVFFELYARKTKMDKNLKYTIAIAAIISLIVGIAFAIIFQSVFDAIKGVTNRKFAMTFYGGLIGGVSAFLVLFYVHIKKKNPNIKLLDILIIAPAAVSVVHAFGRIGCFCAGCCYGIETDSWLGVQFPHLLNPRYPTQLFEAFFLFILAGVLFYLACKKRFIYNTPLYLISYGIWRFLIEFIRGDERGAFFLFLSPSQWFSIITVLGGLIILFSIYKQNQKNHNFEKGS